MSSRVLTVSPNLHDIAAIASKIALSEEEQEFITNRVNSWDAEKWKSLSRRAQTEVVIPQVYKNFSVMDINPPMWNDIKALYYNTWVHKQNLLSEAKKVEDSFSHQEIPFLFLKGLAVDSLYHEGWRAMADIDILVKDFEAARKSLSEIGYVLDDMWIAQQGEFGVANLYCLKRKTKIDLHFGEYPVHSLGSFHLPIWERRNPSEPSMSHENILLVLAAHVFNHGFYLMRDINDVYLLVQNEIDWHYVAEWAQTLHLEKPLSFLLKAAISVYDIHPDYMCKSAFSFLYKYGRRRHLFQRLLQLHHLLILSHAKNLVSYPRYVGHSYFSDTRHIIDPPWIGKASPRWINRIDRKRLCDMGEEAFDSILGSKPLEVQDMRFVFEQSGLYVEKQDLQEKDMERARRIIRSAARKADHNIAV